MMIKSTHEQPPEIWRDLAERASLEQGQAKRMELSRQFNRELASSESSKKKVSIDAV